MDIVSFGCSVPTGEGESSLTLYDALLAMSGSREDHYMNVLEPHLTADLLRSLAPDIRVEGGSFAGSLPDCRSLNRWGRREALMRLREDARQQCAEALLQSAGQRGCGRLQRPADGVCEWPV